MGSFICVKQECCHCDHTYTWKSQPFVKDTPATNLLMSAAIMFSGSMPGKVLLVLKHLNMASIKERTFLIIKKVFGSILSVWNESQTSLLSECVSNGLLTIGGDCRADSPGHSAKYGSYGVIDLSSNKVIHVELVQIYICNMYYTTLCYKCCNRAIR